MKDLTFLALLVILLSYATTWNDTAAGIDQAQRDLQVQVDANQQLQQQIDAYRDVVQMLKHRKDCHAQPTTAAYRSVFGFIPVADDRAAVEQGAAPPSR